MATLREEAKAFTPTKKPFCIECGKHLKDYRSNRCRRCYYDEYRNNPNKALGYKNINWKGNNVGYRALHQYLQRHKVKPKYCEFCKINKPTDIAKISKEYTRNIEDYKYLCRRCHNNYDGTSLNIIKVNNRRYKNGKRPKT
jgi:hypothetical protein